MSYPPYCMHSHINSNTKQLQNKVNKIPLIWCCDYDASDIGIDLEGIVGVYSCSNEDCELIYEIMDLFIDEDTEQRIVKYTRCYEDEGLEENIYHKEEMISSCLYCANPLEEKYSKPTDESYGRELECDGISTILECTCCKTIYDVVDLYPTDDLYNELPLDIRDRRTIFIR